MWALHGRRGASGSVVSAASFTGPNVAPAVHCHDFRQPTCWCLRTSAAAVPLPATLAGVSGFADPSNGYLSAPLFYASPQQINLQVPAGMQRGRRSHRQRQRHNAGHGKLQIEATAPGIFTQNVNGKGVPAALVARIAPDGSIVTEPAFNCAAGPGNCEPAPIDLRPAQRQTYLILFGTGSGIDGPSRTSA